MSDKKNVTKVTETEKVMTKYDRKLQKRKEEAAKAKKEQLKGTLIGVALLVALAAFVLSFPIRSYFAVNSTYITVGGEKVTQVEFDLQYNLAKATFMEQNATYFSLLGTDTSTIESQAYDENLTVGDYFEQVAVSNISGNKGLKVQAEAEGFTYDASAELEELKTNIEELAAEAGVSVSDYMKATYGPLATWNRLKPYFEESAYVSAYYKQVQESHKPSEEEINAEYEANVDTYDSVDFHMSVIDAELPDTASDESIAVDEEGNVIVDEAAEAEVAAAMEIAKNEAELVEANIANIGDEYLSYRLHEVNALLADFLFDESREPGDTTIVEDSANNRYLVASFDKRYRSESPSHDIRAVITATVDGQQILDEWKSGEATEESFQDLVAKYDEMGGEANGGLYTAMEPSTIETEIAEWLEGGRTTGDTAAITVASGTTYVLYYVAENEPVWKLEAENTLLVDIMYEYMEEVTADIEVEDPKGHLEYLQVEAEASSEVAE